MVRCEITKQIESNLDNISCKGVSLCNEEHTSVAAFFTEKNIQSVSHKHNNRKLNRTTASTMHTVYTANNNKKRRD
ncbi:hypothetical protein Bhyg_03606, partial [Pseudolycoriella hygida]